MDLMLKRLAIHCLIFFFCVTCGDKKGREEQVRDINDLFDAGTYLIWMQSVVTAADCENAQVTWRSQEVQDKGGAAEKEEDKWQAAHNAAAHCCNAMEGEGQYAQRSIFQNEFIIRMPSTTANALLPTVN